MRKKSCAVMIDENGQVAVELFDKYVSAESHIRAAKRAKICVEGYACESRYAFAIKQAKEIKPQSEHEQLSVDDFSDIPAGDESDKQDQQEQQDEPQSEREQQEKPRRGRPPNNG